MGFTGESLETGSQKPRRQCIKGTGREFPEEEIRALDNHLEKAMEALTSQRVWLGACLVSVSRISCSTVVLHLFTGGINRQIVRLTDRQKEFVDRLLSEIAGACC